MPPTATGFRTDMTAASWDYENLTGRPPGALLSAIGRALPRVAAVQAQVAPYARAWRAANLEALHGDRRRWIVLGDSMAQGIGAPSPFAGWVTQLQQMAQHRGVDLAVINLSASGARVSDVLGQQLPALRALPPHRRSAGPDIVTVLIGSNDLLARRNRELLPSRFGSLIRAVPAGSIVSTLPQPRRAAQAVNAELEAARAAGVLKVLDMHRHGPPSWRGRLAADHFHPNEAGYRAIADAFLPLVLEAAS